MFAKKNLNNSKIDKAFCGALIIALTGFFFPFIVALLTTLAEKPKVFFKQILFSNYAASVVVCGIFSIALMWLSIPVYKFLTHWIKSKGVMPKSEEACLDAKACASDPEIAA